MSEPTETEVAPPVQEKFVMDELYDPERVEETFEEDAQPLGEQTPFSEDTMRNAGTGQFENPMLYMWLLYLEGAYAETQHPLSIPLADGLMRQWPWFRYYDLPQYLLIRGVYIQEAIAVLRGLFETPEEDLIKENVDDWLIHRKLYIETMVAWTRLVNRWTAEWGAIPITKPAKAIYHASISDVAALLIAKGQGLIEQLPYLAKYDLTDDERDDINARAMLESDDE